MAFGDFIKSNRNSQSSGTSLVTDLGSNPTTGNLLVMAAVGSASSDFITSPPSGSTLLTDLTTGSGANWYWYYRISTGGEQTQSITWTLNNTHAQIVAEYEWDGSVPTISTNEDETHATNTTTTQATGAVTPDTATNIVIAFHGTDLDSNSDGGQAVDGSWIEDTVFVNSGDGGVKLSRLVNASGSQEATHTSSDTVDQMYGAIAAFSVATSGVVLLRRRIEGY